MNAQHLRWMIFAFLFIIVFGALAMPAVAQPASATSPVLTTCSQLFPHCAVCGGNPYLRCETCQKGYGFNSHSQCVACSTVSPDCDQCEYGQCQSCRPGFELEAGQCVPCSQIDPECTSCARGACNQCASGFGVTNGGTSCELCTSIDPECTACSNGACSTCASGYGVTDGGASCEACASVDPNCTHCANGACTSCAAGYGVTNNGASCETCASIDPNCSTCKNGTCTQCTNGYAANEAGQCVQPGTSGCSYDLNGQCCKCEYSCLGWNPTSGSCVGSPSNACGNSCDPYSRQ